MDYIKLFSTDHLSYIGFFTLFFTTFLYLPSKFERNKIEIFLSIFILGIKLISDGILYFTRGYPLHTLCPIHVCNVSLILCLIMMVQPNFTGFQFVFYSSLGALAAILFPEAVRPFPDFTGFSFFITHFFIIFVIIYQMKYMKFRPTLKGLFTTYIYLNLLAVIAYKFNNYFSTNYMYINHKPITPTPIDFFGPWPFYIIVVELVFLILNLIMYRIFKSKNQNIKIIKQENPSE